MNNRRMFSNRIANSSKFLQMPMESQLLYFHMVLRADDDGVVESYPIMRLLGFAPDNFKVLVAKNFIQILNEDQVILILDWLEHNKIRADRKTDSIYKALIPKNVETIDPKPRSDVKDNSQRLGGPSTVSISKVKLSKVKLSKVSKTDKEKKLFEQFWKQYPNKKAKSVALKSFAKLNVGDDLLATILNGLNKYKKTEQWKQQNGRFIPHPSTWLNQRRWEDEIQENFGNIKGEYEKGLEDKYKKYDTKT